jgi:antitoxin ParD1/3/4
LTNFAKVLIFRRIDGVAMPTMNVSLSAELAAFVEDEVASGEYGTASEVVRDGLRRLLRNKAVREEKAAILRREVGRGLDQARAGQFSQRSVAEIAAAIRERAERKGGTLANRRRRYSFHGLTTAIPQPAKSRPHRNRQRSGPSPRGEMLLWLGFDR